MMCKKLLIKIIALSIVAILVFGLFVFTVSGCSIMDKLIDEARSSIGNSIENLANRVPSENNAAETGAASPEETAAVTPPLILDVYIDRAIPYSLWLKVYRQFRITFNHMKSLGINDYSGFELSRNKEDADIVLGVGDPASSSAQTAGSGASIKKSVCFVPVVSYYSLVEDISAIELSRLWKGYEPEVYDIEGNKAQASLMVEKNGYPVLKKVFGTIAGNAEILENQAIKNKIKNDLSAIALVPFSDISPEYKVLKIDGVCPFDTGFDMDSYPLSAAVTLDFSQDIEVSTFESIFKENFYKNIFTDISEEDIKTVLVTGVTALTRQVAARMDANGILYPAEKIAGLLKDADCTHISNEVSFVEECYAARPNTMVFCSKPEYLELIEYIGTDIIELTGNHLNDYGPEWLEYTIDKYEEKGLPYYGGGKNLEDSLRPAYFTSGDLKLAFIGANSFGPSSDWAGEDSAGSSPINTLDEASKEKDMLKFEKMVRDLKDLGYSVIFTFQYLETYNYTPTAQQVKDFERISDAGADIVSGSQAHQPQGVEIRDGRFINFGMGNLFFGQAMGIEVKQGLISRHIFYKGKYINTILYTTLVEDFSQPRVTEGQERADLLKAVFNGSIKEEIKENNQ